MDNNTIATNTENASSLKYEKTQNRDVVGTIERINRSQQFKPLSEKFLDSIGKSISEFATKEFRQQWRNKTEKHENPQNFNIEVSIGSPIYKNPSDKPYYYIMSLSTAFHVECTPLENETPVEAETRMSSWFFENIAQKLNLSVVEHTKSILEADEELKDLVSFTLLQKVDEDEQGKIGCKKPVVGKINVSYMSSIKAKKNDSVDSDIVPYKDSEMVRDGLISNIALAVERIKNNPVEDVSSK
jgi:hypothetical protein